MVRDNWCIISKTLKNINLPNDTGTFLNYNQESFLHWRYEVKVLDELETKVEAAVHDLRLGWSSDDTDMQLGKKYSSIDAPFQANAFSN